MAKEPKGAEPSSGNKTVVVMAETGVWLADAKEKSATKRYAKGDEVVITAEEAKAFSKDGRVHIVK